MADEQRDIETSGRELVIKHDGRVHRSPVPDGFSPGMFRHIIAAVDLLYRRNGAIPTINEVMASWEGFDKATVSKAWSTPEFKEALSIRGIELDIRQGLSAEQLYCIQILSDPSDRRSNKARLESVGVPIGKYRAWMRNPVFARALSDQAEQNLGDGVSTAINRLLAAGDAGEPWAVNKILEISGRWNPNQQELQNARTVVLTVMEVLQSKIKDKELLREIVDEVRSRQTTLTIVQSLRELN